MYWQLAFVLVWYKLNDSSETVYGTCFWALLNFASMLYCERRSVCCVWCSLLGQKLHYIDFSCGLEVTLYWLLLKGKQMLPPHFIRYNWPLLFVGILVTCSIKTAACSRQLSLVCFCKFWKLEILELSRVWGNRLEFWTTCYSSFKVCHWNLIHVHVI